MDATELLLDNCGLPRELADMDGFNALNMERSNDGADREPNQSLIILNLPING